MEGLDIALQYGPLGIFAAYMIKKEMLWEADKKALTDKYEVLLKEAVTKATEMKAALSELTDEIRQLKGAKTP